MDGPMSAEELNKRVAERKAERKKEDADAIEEMEEHPRFAILPSPDKLDRSINSSGEDKIATREDFDIVWKWVKKSGLLNHQFYKDVVSQVKEGRQLETGLYNTLIRIALKDVFDPIRNTASPEKEEMVLLYYTGHGRDGESAGEQNVGPTPNLGELVCPNYFQAANRFITPNRPLQGGEFYLHHVGYCDLEGLLQPWIAALKEKSAHLPAGVVKKNKHLVVIADSCYSGKLAENLEILAMKSGPWNENGCSVTVQAACSADELTFGGYFTSCFVFYNQNRERLEQLKQVWREKCLPQREYFNSIELPSPKVVSTTSRLSLQCVQATTIQGFELTLFPNPAFFKFCYLSMFNQPSDLHFRALNNSSVNTFLSSASFTVIDYKLKKMASGRFAGTPMGLFLVEDPSDQNRAVCAHIHFRPNDTRPSRVTAINLVHHVYTPNAYIVCPEEFPQSRVTIANPISSGAQDLVQACRQFVISKEPSRWGNVATWDMKHSFERLFKRSRSKCLLT